MFRRKLESNQVVGTLAAHIYTENDSLREMAYNPGSSYFYLNNITIDVMLSIMARKILALEASLEDVDAQVGGTE